MDIFDEVKAFIDELLDDDNAGKARAKATVEVPLQRTQVGTENKPDCLVLANATAQDPRSGFDSPSPDKAGVDGETFEPSVPVTPATTADTTPSAPEGLPAGPATSQVFTDEYKIPMPSFVTSDLAAAVDIRNFATLTVLRTARWHAKVKDRKAARDAAEANDAKVEHVGVFQKNLLAGADAKLKAIHKVIDDCRADYYRMTLPWTTVSMDDVGRRQGARLLPNTMFEEFIVCMGTHKNNMRAAVQEFVPLYPDLMEQARVNLGRLFRVEEYPPANLIEQHFDITFDFAPIPEGRDFRGLPQQQLDALARAVNEKNEKMMENAMQDVWTRLYEAVCHMADRLSEPDRIFHHTMVEKVRDMAHLLSHLNVTNDARIETLRARVEKDLCPHDVETLRKESVLRKRVAALAQGIVDDMNKMGGVP